MPTIKQSKIDLLRGNAPSSTVGIKKSELEIYNPREWKYRNRQGVKKDTDYNNANYLESKVTFKITWESWAGIVWQSIVPEGQIPIYKGPLLISPPDTADQEFLGFSRWSPTVKAATEDITYSAEFNYQTVGSERPPEDPDEDPDGGTERPEEPETERPEEPGTERPDEPDEPREPEERPDERPNEEPELEEP